MTRIEPLRRAVPALVIPIVLAGGCGGTTGEQLGVTGLEVRGGVEVLREVATMARQEHPPVPTLRVSVHDVLDTLSSARSDAAGLPGARAGRLVSLVDEATRHGQRLSALLGDGDRHELRATTAALTRLSGRLDAMGMRP